jgi:ribonuclease R
VRVQVSRVDLDARKIDFRLVRDTPIKPGVRSLEKGGPAQNTAVREEAPRRSRKKAAPAASPEVQVAREARSTAKKRTGRSASSSVSTANGAAAPAKKRSRKKF